MELQRLGSGVGIILHGLALVAGVVTKRVSQFDLLTPPNVVH
jgi:hypothetical protein